MSDMQDIMKLEILPNEILFQCFEYFNAFEIFYSFDQLNYRFNNLIRNIPLCINLEYMNKSIFDEFCTKMLLNPEIKSQIYSLKLLNKREYLHTEVFLSFFSLDQFPHLQKLKTKLVLMYPSWSLYWIHPDARLDPGLAMYYEFKEADLPLSKLQTLSVSSIKCSEMDINEILPIINLKISYCRVNELCELLKYTPMLKYLHIEALCENKSEDTKTYFCNQYVPNLKQVIIDDACGNFTDIEMFIKQITNLKSLTIAASTGNDDIIDACRWEHLITSSLPYLDIFKFRFCYSPFSWSTVINDNTFIVDKFKQFQTDFWQKEHHWYTKYVVKKTSDSMTALIYTISYISNRFDIRSTATSYDDSRNNVNRFDEMTNLRSYPIVLGVKSFNDLKKNVNLSELKHLYILFMKSSLILLKILKAAPRLSILRIETTQLKSFLYNKEVCKYLNKRIKSLTLHDLQQSISINNTSEATQFCKIFTNIEHLECSIDHEDSLLFLLNHLPKLSTLNITLWYYAHNRYMYRFDYALERHFDRFRNEARKLNVIYTYSVTWGWSCCTRKPHGVDTDYYGLKIFIWIGKKDDLIV